MGEKLVDRKKAGRPCGSKNKPRPRPSRPSCSCGRLVETYVFADGARATATTCASCTLPERNVLDEAAS